MCLAGVFGLVSTLAVNLEQSDGHGSYRNGAMDERIKIRNDVWRWFGPLFLPNPDADATPVLTVADDFLLPDVNISDIMSTNETIADEMRQIGELEALPNRTTTIGATTKHDFINSFLHFLF